MTSKSAAQRRNTLDRQRRRRRLAAFDRLEDRRLLTWTFSISGTTATATSDGAADTLYLAELGGVVEYSTDGTTFSNNWGGASLPASSSSIINIDPRSGTTNAHTIQLGAPTVSAASAIQATVNVVNGGPSVALTIDDSTDASAASGTNAYAINNGVVTTPLGINVHGPTSGSVLGGGITLLGGTAADTYNETGTRAGEPITLTGGNGGNTFNITGSSSTTTVNVGTGTNTVSVGGASGVGAQNVTGAVNVSGSGSTTLAADNLLGTVTPEAVNLTATQLTGVSPGTIDFSGLTNISTFAFGTTNAGGATINVQGAPTVTSTVRIVDGSGGTNAINLGDATHAAGALPAELFQLVSTGSATNLTVDDSADTNPGIATVTASTVNFGATHQPNINFASASLASLTLDGGSGGNTISVTGTPGSITTTINSGSGVDNVDVQATGTGGTLTVDTQAGSSANNVTLGGVAGVGAQNIQGTINVQSTGGSVALTVDDSQDATARTVSLGNTALTGLTPATINLVGGLSALTARGGSGGNSFAVTNTPNLADVTLDTGGGADTVDVQATGSSGFLTIDTQGGTADGVTLGGVAGVGAQNLQEIVAVQATGGAANLTVDDSQDSTARSSVSLGQSQLSGLTPQAIEFNNLASMTIEGGSGGNTVTVTGTPAGTATTLDTGGGNDSVDVQGTGTGGSLTIDTQGDTAAENVTLGGATGVGSQGLQSGVTVQSTGGAANLTVDDSQESANRSGVGLSGTQLTGLAPSTINFSNLASLTVNFSSGADTASVVGTPVGATTTLTFSASTSNALTLGSPTVAAVTLGSLTLNGTFGLTIDDSADNTGGTITFQGAGISFGAAPSPTFGYFGDYIESLTIDAPATAAETIDVAFSPYLPMGTQILLAMGSSASNAVEVGTGGLGATRLNGVTVTGTTALTIDDTNSTGAHTATFTSSSLAFGPSMPTYDYGGATLTGLTYLANPSGGTADVQGSPSGPSGLAPLTLAMGTATGSSVDLGNQADALGAVAVTTGVGGSTSLVVNDTSGSASWTYSITATGLAIVGGPTFTYGGATLSGLQLQTDNNGGNTVNVTGTPALPAGQALSISAFTGTGNAVNLGDATHAASALGSVSVGSGNGGPLAVTVDDTFNSAPADVSIGTTGVSFGVSPLPTFDYSGATLASLTVDGGSGGNTVNVTGTPGGITTDLNSGGAIDTVQVQATGAGGTLNIDTQGGLSADSVTLGGAPGVGAQGLQGTIHVQSTGGAAVLNIDDGADPTGQSATLASLSPTEATLTGIAPATIDLSLSAVGNMGIATDSAANTLTVDCTAGDPLPAILRFTGAGGNTLDLHGSGGNFTAETYLATGPGAGSLNFDAAHQVLFSQLTPINDTVPVSTFTFSAPAGSTAFNVVDGPTADGFATTQVASPTNAFELINFANKPTATLNASGSGTAILLNNPNPGAGLQALTIHGGAGNDNATIQAAPAGVTTAVDLGGGDDQASLTPAALPATGSLAIDGGTGTNTVTANAATTTANTGTAGHVGFGTGGSFAYQNVQTLDVTALNSPPVLAPGSSLSATAGQALNNAVVATFTDPDSSETAGAYQATIAWGDGTTSAGTIVADPNHAGTFDVIGSHTYATSGTKTTSVSLTDQGGTFPSMAGSTAVSATLAPLAGPVTGPGAPVSVQATPQPTPNPNPPDDHVTGSVDDGPDAGPRMPDGFEVTRDDTPSFRGTAGPGALIQVFATGTFLGAPHVLIASTTADATGHWSVMSFLPLPDGGYTLSAAATPPPAGLIVGPVAQVAPSSASIGGLVVDTHGPVVDAIAFDRLHGLVTLTFQDGLTGLDPATLADPASYQVTASPLTAAVHVPKTITVTHVAVGPIVSPTAPVTVVLTLNNGRLLRGGRYTFQVLALGLRDMAGNPLNGAFTGTFPTGGGLYTAATTPGGSNFLAQITTFHRRVFPAVPVTTTSQVTKAKALHLTSTTRIPQAPGHVHDAALAALSSSVKLRPRRR